MAAVLGGLKGLQNGIASVGGVQPNSTVDRNAKTDGAEFRSKLNQALGPEGTRAPAAVSALKFSNHAVDRMRTRGISFDPAKLEKIEQAVSKAAAKGSKNTLLLTDESAMIVSVKDKTVVTVLDKSNMKDNVFTNIDSTIMI